MQKKLEQINKLLVEYYGIPRKADNPPDPLDLIIATILSQNTNDRNSYKAFASLKEKYPRLRDLQNVRTNRLENTIRTAGLARQKAYAIKSLLKYLEKRGEQNLNYLKELPDKEVLNELTGIKGIGIKTASCVLLFSFERDVCPVDTHVHRVLNRIGVVKTSGPDKTFISINNKIPPGRGHQLHTNLIRLGREICKPAVPVCYICPVRKICKYPAKDFAGKGKLTVNNFFLLDNI